MKKRKNLELPVDAERSTSQREPERSSCFGFHLIVGWTSLLVFASLGVALEYLHAFRISWYLDLGEPEVRRTMWTLAHTHGGMIAILHIAYALTLAVVTDWQSQTQVIASNCLTAAGVLMPLGFFLGGVFVYDGDPGMGVLLVPLGALLLLASILLTSLAMIYRKA